MAMSGLAKEQGRGVSSVTVLAVPRSRRLHLRSRAAIHRPKKLQALVAFFQQHAVGPMEPGEQVTGDAG